MIHPDVIVAPLQAAIVESMESESFLDLSLHLPEGMTTTDTRTFIEDYVLNHMDNAVSLGRLIVLVDGEAFYFSSGMMKNIATECLPPLIEEYAKSRAFEIANTQDSTSTELDNSIPSSKTKKGGRSSKSKTKGRSKTSTAESETVSYSMVPLINVANEVAKHYSDLADIQASYSVHEKEDGPVWGDDDGDSDGPLYAFCRHVFGTSKKFEEDCANAVQAELVKAMAVKKGSTMHSTGHGAAKFKSVDVSFEESFKNVCHLVQVLAKYPQSLLNTQANDNIRDKETQAFLNGCAADFVRRVTEYCLFKHGVEDGKFTFFAEEDEGSTGFGDAFYMDVDTTTRVFKKVFLSCPSSEEEVGHQDPLKILRGCLPGSVGVGVARMWVLTGGENYASGERISADGEITYSRGDLERFLSHSEESCL